MMNSLSLTTNDKTIVNGIRQKRNVGGSIYLYTYNNRIRSTMILGSELKPYKTGSILVLKIDKTVASACLLMHYFDHEFSSFRSVLL